MKLWEGVLVVMSQPTDNPLQIPFLVGNFINYQKLAPSAVYQLSIFPCVALSFGGSGPFCA